MSIHLREGFSDETLERVLEDLAVRFVINCPPEDLSSVERVLFQIEEAHWFYEDFLRALNPLLPGMKMKQFTKRILQRCPLVWRWKVSPNEAVTQFGHYKSIIPVRGCAIFNEALDRILLVQGTESPSWSFPRGKISKGESDSVCAIREVKEETGFDSTPYFDEDEYTERTIHSKNYKIYFVKGVPDDAVFHPIARNEIRHIRWFSLASLPRKVRGSNGSDRFYLVDSMMKPIYGYIRRVKNAESDDQLKKKATLQLKRLLGVPVAADAKKAASKRSAGKHLASKPPASAVDPGRALLTMLQRAAASNNSAAEHNPALSSAVSVASVPSTSPATAVSASQIPAAARQVLPGILPGLLPQPAPGAPAVGPGFSFGVPPFLLPFFNPFFSQAAPLPPQFPVPPPAAQQVPALPPQQVSSQPVGNGLQQLLPPAPMAVPAASTFSKPTFSAPASAARPMFQQSPVQPSNGSQQLLSLLKHAPQQTQPKVTLLKRPGNDKKAGAAELLGILRQKKPQSKSSSPVGAPVDHQKIAQLAEVSHTQPTSSSSREQDESSTSTAKQLLGIIKNGPKSSSHSSLPNQKPDITKNEDPSSYLLGLLKKDQPNVDQTSQSPSATSAPIETIHVHSTDSASAPPVQTESAPVRPTHKSSSRRNSFAGAAADQLLSILRHPFQGHSQSGTNDHEEDGTSITRTKSHGAKSLLDILKKPHKAERQHTEEPKQPKVDAAGSSSLLSLLKHPKKDTVVKEPAVENDEEPLKSEEPVEKPVESAQNTASPALSAFTDFSDFSDIDEVEDENNHHLDAYVQD